MMGGFQSGGECSRTISLLDGARQVFDEAQRLLLPNIDRVLESRSAPYWSTQNPEWRVGVLVSSDDTVIKFSIRLFLAHDARRR
jgi:hypothetical protein